MKAKIKALLGIILVMSSPLVVAAVIIGFISCFNNLNTIKKVYQPDILIITGYFSRGMYSADFNSFTGKIKDEEKSIIVNDSIFTSHPNHIYVFNCQGDKNLILRKKDEFILSKKPYIWSAILRFIIPIITALLWWFSLRHISLSVRSVPQDTTDEE